MMTPKVRSFCRECTFKHLSQARVVWGEMNNGYEPTVEQGPEGRLLTKMDASHLAKFVGHMSEAESHIQFHDKQMAKDIRLARMAVWAAAAMRLTSVVDIDFAAWLTKLLSEHVDETTASMQDQSFEPIPETTDQKPDVSTFVTHRAKKRK